MKRRQFLKSIAFTGTAGLILPRTTLFGAGAPSNKLNIALIATGHRAAAHFKVMGKENVVSICDVNQEHLASGAKLFPGAKTYVDWRECLDQKDIQAIVGCTPDHTHAFIANWAMNRGMHVYSEKPLANTVEESRVVRATYLKNKNKLATQMGTQRHEHENFARVADAYFFIAFLQLADHVLNSILEHPPQHRPRHHRIHLEVDDLAGGERRPWQRQALAVGGLALRQADLPAARDRRLPRRRDLRPRPHARARRVRAATARPPRAREPPRRRRRPA